MQSPELKTIDTQVQTSFTSLEEELKKLREDKEILEGKIRGYLTLSEICHEYKEELRKLQAEYNKLLQKEQMKAKHLYSESPAPENDLDRHDRPDLEQRTTKPKNPSSTALPNTDIATELTRDKQIRTSDLFDQGQTNTSKTDNDLNLNTPSLTRVSEKAGNSFIVSQEKFPMQESIADEEGLTQPSPQSSQPSQSVTGLGFVPSSSGGMSLGQSAGNYKPSENSDLMNFSFTPSLNAKEINQKQDNELETVLRSIRLDLEDSSHGDKVASLVKDYTDRTEAKIVKQSKANAVLIDKNNELKKKLHMMEKDCQLTILRVKKLEQEKYDMTPSRSTSPAEANGWVHVQKVTKGETQQASEHSDEETKRLEQLHLHPAEKIDDLKWLQTHYRQLREANMRWSEEWDKLKYHYDQRIKEVEDERDRIEKTLTDKKLLEETRQRDFERAMSELREKASDEEKGKEEALLQLTTCNNRLEQMQKQISELSDKNSVLRREKQAKESEINVLRQGISTTRSSPSDTTRTGRSGKTVEDMKTENAVLHQQLLVFQEDFERERQDRATAQSLKDDYKKQNESLKKRVRHAEQKLAAHERQLKSAEETSKRTLVENERLQQELTDLKNQQRRREEELNRTMMAANYLPQAPPIMQTAGLHPGSQPMYAGPQPQMAQPQYMTRPQPQPPYAMQMQQVPQYQAVGGYMPASGAQTTPARPAGNQYSQANQQQGTQRATEHLPGSWSCNQCTYVNYPGRTVCEMCGYIQSPTNQNNFRYPTGGNDILMPRGEENQQRPAPYQYNYQAAGQNIGPNPGNRAV